MCIPTFSLSVFFFLLVLVGIYCGPLLYCAVILQSKKVKGEHQKSDKVCQCEWHGTWGSIHLANSSQSVICCVASIKWISFFSRNYMTLVQPVIVFVSLGSSLNSFFSELGDPLPVKS